MIPGPFDYHRPGSIEEAVETLAQLGDDARVIAGGHSLIPMMKLRMAVPAHLVDLQDIAALNGILDEGGTIAIGAMTTQKVVIGSAPLAAACPILRETARQIADPQVRYVGTIGGNVANGDPANDMPAVMLALDATFVLQGPDGSREVAAHDFYQGVFSTALGEAEILTTIRISKPADGHGWAYEKQKRKIGDYATAATAVVLTMSSGVCESAAIALTNVGDTPLLAVEAAKALVGTTLDKAAINAAANEAEAITSPASDGRGPAAFRTKIAGVMTRRAIAAARERAA